MKLYPPMEFKPLGNKGEADWPDGAPNDPNFGLKLDTALTELYTWCVAEDVPIMTHCSYSQFAKPAYGLRAAPENWRAVIGNPAFAGLRVNLGHCGGFWDVVDNKGQPSAGWAATAIGMMDKDNALYADVADDDHVLDADALNATSNDATIMSGLANQFVANPLAKQRLMYGSDWSLLGRNPGTENYYPMMKQIVTSPAPAGLALNAAETADFFGGNAARFLGLASIGGVKPKSRQRLETYYNKHGLDQTVLTYWDT